METGIFKGVYSTAESLQTGSPGASAPGHTQARKRYWFVWEHDAGGYVVQPLSASMEPMGERRAVSKADLSEGYVFEPDILAVPLLPSPSFLHFDEKPQPGPATDAVSVDAADGHCLARRCGDIAGSELGEQTERILRADFAIALAQLRRGERDRAVHTLERLAERPGEFVPAHCHMFTDFGINLRKSKLPRIAIRHHLRALELAPDDGHVHFNIARAYYDLGEMNRAEDHLRESLGLAPDLKSARCFLDFLLRRKSGAANDDRKA